MKLSLIIFTLFSACTVYSAQVQVLTQAKTTVKMPVFHFKHVVEKLEDEARETKEVNCYMLELEKEVHKDVCVRMFSIIGAFQKDLDGNDPSGDLFKQYIAKLFKKETDSFILMINLDKHRAKFWDFKSEEWPENFFSNYYGDVHCLAIYDNHP